jgi:D-sedoheptulose 7-phosphate isomerase
VDILATESKYSMANLSEQKYGTVELQALLVQHMHELARCAELAAGPEAAGAVRAMELMADSLRHGGKILACGNGGSATDAQHLVAELVGRMSFEREALPALSMTCDGAVLTALGNDYGYDEVFARQVRGLGRAGDVLVVLSTSGRSPNVVKAAVVARQMGIRVVALTGYSADPTLELADAWIRVESRETTHIQEIHTALIHTMCLGMERMLRQQRGVNSPLD